MTRLEENQLIINSIIEGAKSKPSGTYEELVIFNLGAIATTLTDISKALQSLLIKQKARKSDEGE